MVPVSLGAITVYSCREELNLNKVYQKNGAPFFYFLFYVFFV
eukprot:COSAG01_NODE_6434_length_3669_cov_1.916527_8_plen_42_part_00